MEKLWERFVKSIKHPHCDGGGEEDSRRVNPRLTIYKMPDTELIALYLKIEEETGIKNPAGNQIKKALKEEYGIEYKTDQVIKKRFRTINAERRNKGLKPYLLKGQHISDEELIGAHERAKERKEGQNPNGDEVDEELRKTLGQSPLTCIIRQRFKKINSERKKLGLSALIIASQPCSGRPPKVSDGQIIQIYIDIYAKKLIAPTIKEIFAVIQEEKMPLTESGLEYRLFYSIKQKLNKQNGLSLGQLGQEASINYLNKVFAKESNRREEEIERLAELGSKNKKAKKRMCILLRNTQLPFGVRLGMAGILENIDFVFGLKDRMLESEVEKINRDFAYRLVIIESLIYKQNNFKEAKSRLKTLIEEYNALYRDLKKHPKLAEIYERAKNILKKHLPDTSSGTGRRYSRRGFRLAHRTFPVPTASNFDFWPLWEGSDFGEWLDFYQKPRKTSGSKWAYWHGEEKNLGFGKDGTSVIGPVLSEFGSLGARYWPGYAPQRDGKKQIRKRYSTMREFIKRHKLLNNDPFLIEASKIQD